MAGDGVLLHGEGQQGDYISLELRRARLQLSINLGILSYTCVLPWQSVLPPALGSETVLFSASGSNMADVFLSPPAGSNQYGSIQGHTSVTSGSLLDDDHWHSVRIERFRRNVNFTLDHHTQQFRTNGEFDHLDLDHEVRPVCFELSEEVKLSCVYIFLRSCHEGYELRSHVSLPPNS